MADLNPTSRADALERLRDRTFDLLVVGGGITGAGIALDAASRGLRVALAERDDFASGTSSRSSKLVHGGLRYLANYEISLTREAARERNLLRRLAPGLVQPQRFLYPILRRGREARFARVGLAVYDAFAGLRGFRAHRRAREATIRAIAPRFDPARAVVAYTYWDARTDDARLVFEVIRTAHRFGAVACNHLAVRGLEKTRGRITGATVEDRLSGESFTVGARVVVNAGGVWAEDVAGLDDPEGAPRLRPAKGIHLVLPAERVPLADACIFPSAARDRRSLFAIPWGPVVIVGTSDTSYEGSLDAPAVDSDDAAYVLNAVNSAFDAGCGPGDCVAAWAGLRPLRHGAAERTADLSRRHALSVSPAGLITITGGKLTTYRRMAAEATDRACRELGVRARSRTHRIRIGLRGDPAALTEEVRRLAARLDLDPDLAGGLVASYGDRAPGVLALAAEDPGLGRPVVPGLPTLYAEVAWAFRNEMAVTLEDALWRRTSLALRDSGAGAGDSSALAHAAGRPVDAIAAEAERYAARIARERGPIPSPLQVA